MKANKLFHAVVLFVLGIIGAIGTSEAQKKSIPEEPIAWAGNLAPDGTTASVLVQSGRVTFLVAQSCGPGPNAKLRRIKWALGEKTGKGEGCDVTTFTSTLPIVLEGRILAILPEEIGGAIERALKKTTT